MTDDSEEINARAIADILVQEEWAVPPLVAAAGACVDLIEMLESHAADISAARVQDILIQHGVLVKRAPTGDELADPNWWGHAQDIKAGAEDVIEMEDDFGNMMGLVSEALEVKAETPA
jgi:hypothetical protein